MSYQSGGSDQARAKLASSSKVTRGHSCTECSQRKVKCDGKRPCSTCIKSARSLQCRSFKFASGARTSLERALISRLKHCEALLTAHGIPFTAEAGLSASLDDGGRPLTVAESEVESPSARSNDGHLIAQRGHHRFVDNTIWSPLGKELDPSECSGVEEDAGNELEELGLGSAENLFLPRWTLNDPDAVHEGPDVGQVLKLWDVFLDNFNPLTKVFHAPSVQKLLSEAVALESASSSVPKNTRALMSAIFLSAVTTLTDEECFSHFSEPKETLLHRFSCMTQQRLIASELLRSTDPIILQALTLYLLATRGQIDSQSHWLLTGLATRLAQTMGLHREHSLKQLKPFDAELRRRLWWQIVMLDDRSSQLLGVAGGTFFHADTKVPINVNDSDLSPYMMQPLESSPGPTEMLFCTIRLQIGLCMRRLKMATLSYKATADKEAIIDAFEKSLEAILKQCEPSIPLHLLSVFLGRSAVCQMRFAMLQADPNHQTSPEIGDRLFGLALQILQYDARSYANRSLQRFLWHVGSSFPFQAMIHILINLLVRTPSGDEMQQAWLHINQALEDHPELILEVNNPLYFALGNLTLKAWAKFAVLSSGPSTSGLDADWLSGSSRGSDAHPAVMRLQAHRAGLATGATAQTGDTDASSSDSQMPASWGFDMKTLEAQWPQTFNGSGGYGQVGLMPDMEPYSQYLQQDLWMQHEYGASGSQARGSL